MIYLGILIMYSHHMCEMNVSETTTEWNFYIRFLELFEAFQGFKQMKLRNKMTIEPGVFIF